MTRLNKLSLLRWAAPLGLSLAAFTLPAQAVAGTSPAAKSAKHCKT